MVIGRFGIHQLTNHHVELQWPVTTFDVPIFLRDGLPLGPGAVGGRGLVAQHKELFVGVRGFRLLQPRAAAAAEGAQREKAAVAEARRRPKDPFRRGPYFTFEKKTMCLGCLNDCLKLFQTYKKHDICHVLGHFGVDD